MEKLILSPQELYIRLYTNSCYSKSRASSHFFGFKNEITIYPIYWNKVGIKS